MDWSGVEPEHVEDSCICFSAVFLESAAWQHFCHGILLAVPPDAFFFNFNVTLLGFGGCFEF